MGLFRARKNTTVTRWPTEAVQDAVAQGISSRRKIYEVTNLQRVAVDLILDRMEHTGQLRRESLGGMCPGGGCSSCGASDSGTCVGGSTNSGPVALVPTRRPPSAA